MGSGDQLEHFSLRWNNFNDNMKSGFHDLLRTEDFVDVTIAAEGKLVQAHKMVLSVCSPYFKNIFKTNPCQHPVVFLKDVTHKELSGILQFMYLGEVSIQQEELGRFLKTAEALQIKGLTGDDDNRNESVNELIEANHKHPVRNKTKLENIDLGEKETCSKKIKLNSNNDIVKNNGRESPIHIISNTIIDNENHNSVYPKTEPAELDITDVECDRISLKEENVSVSESYLQFSDNITDLGDDVSEPSNTPNSSGLPPDPLTGSQGLSNEPFLMADGNQEIRKSGNAAVPGFRKFPGGKERFCFACSRKDGGPVRRSPTIYNQYNKV